MIGADDDGDERLAYYPSVVSTRMPSFVAVVEGVWLQELVIRGEIWLLNLGQNQRSRWGCCEGEIGGDGGNGAAGDDEGDVSSVWMSVGTSRGG